MNPEELLDRPIAYHRAFVQFGGVSCAILLSQAMYWSKRTSNPDGWFYKTREEWKDETGLGRKAQEASRERLVELGILEEELRGIPARLYFRINKRVLTSMLQGYQQVGMKGTNKVVLENQPQNEATVEEPTITETTSETTQQRGKENHEEKKEVTTNSSFVDSSVEAEQRTSKNSLTACTDLELWTIAKSKNLRLEDVKFKHKQIMDMIADGEFQQRYKKHKTVYRTLQKWLDMSLERGYIQECNEIEQMLLDNQHPDIQAQIKWAREQAQKRGDV